MPAKTAEPVTLQSLVTLLERVGREVNTLQRKVDDLNNRLPPMPYEAPIEYPWVKPYNEHLMGLNWNGPTKIADAIRQCLSQTDGAVRDIQRAAAKIDQLCDGDYLSSDVRDWLQSSET